MSQMSPQMSHLETIGKSLIFWTDPLLSERLIGDRLVSVSTAK